MKLTEQKNDAPDMSFMIAFIYFIALLFGIILVAYDLIRSWYRELYQEPVYPVILIVSVDI